MKGMLITPSPSTANPMHNNNTKIMEEDNKSDIIKESCYYPGCRKDANCNCKMCLDSMSATLDLLPMSAQRSTLTKLSASKPVLQKNPVSIDPTLLSTPPSPVVETPARAPPADDVAFRSTAKSSRPRKEKPKKRKVRVMMMSRFWKWVLLFGLIVGLEFGFPWVVSWGSRPALSGEILEELVQRSSGEMNLSRKLDVIQMGLQGFVDGEVSSCNLGDSTWKIDQDGLMLRSYCTLYQSPAEEVIVWGWPLKTAGLLTASFSSRTYAVVSGRVTEWLDGKIAYVVRVTNSTWMIRKWGASVVKFDANTWVVEYNQSMFLENPSVFFAAVEFYKFCILKLVGRTKQLFWLVSDFRHFGTASMTDAGLGLPT